MKKNAIITILFFLLVFTSCDQPPNSTPADSFFYSSDPTARDTNRLYSFPIHRDSANKMIQSYLTSIHPDINSDELKSLIFDAGLLRNYLNDTTHGKIMHLKMIFAHTPAYINSGHFGLRPDSNTSAITLVLAGYGADGNYIYYNEDYVMDFCQPCPRECPETGSAANDLLTQ